MASKRKPISSAGSSNFNFRPQTESQKWETKGTRPLPNPVSVKGALLGMMIHGCRKIIFVNTRLKVALYLAGLFFSFVCDVVPFPKTYFSKSDNVLNQNFVKLGWFWTLVLTGPFVFMTSCIYCCGKRKLVIMHLSRLLIATVVWFVCTKSFSFIENNFGKCSVKGEKYASKQACISKGYYWHSLDISGHSFILIWSSLVMMEEAKAIIGWERIRDFIRNEEHSRTFETDYNSPLRQLTNEEFHIMKSSYIKFTPYVRGLFIAMTCLTVLWDIMIISTILYFHIMIEKLISGILAVSAWSGTYHYWYKTPGFLPNMPGDGLFRYVNKSRDSRHRRDGSTRNRGNMNSHGTLKGQLPSFMGMPLYGLRAQMQESRESKDTREELQKEDSFFSDPEPTSMTSNRPPSTSTTRGSFPQSVGKISVQPKSSVSNLRSTL